MKRILNHEIIKKKEDFSKDFIPHISFEKSVGKNDMMTCVYILKLNHDGTKLGISSGKKFIKFI